MTERKRTPDTLFPSHWRIPVIQTPGTKPVSQEIRDGVTESGKLIAYGKIVWAYSYNGMPIDYLEVVIGNDNQTSLLRRRTPDSLLVFSGKKGELWSIVHPDDPKNVQATVSLLTPHPSRLDDVESSVASVTFSPRIGELTDVILNRQLFANGKESGSNQNSPIIKIKKSQLSLGAFPYDIQTDNETSQEKVTLIPGMFHLTKDNKLYVLKITQKDRRITQVTVTQGMKTRMLVAQKISYQHAMKKLSRPTKLEATSLTTMWDPQFVEHAPKLETSRILSAFPDDTVISTTFVGAGRKEEDIVIKEEVRIPTFDSSDNT